MVTKLLLQILSLLVFVRMVIYILYFSKSMKKDGKDVEGGRYMRGSDGRQNFSEKDRGKV